MLKASDRLVWGFTLIEILVAMGIFILILTLGLLISMDFAKSFSYRSERNDIGSILQKARGESLNNINQTRHGVHFQGSPLKYIVFECPAATPQCTSYSASSSDYSLDPSYGISVLSPALPFDIIFDQINGSCVNCANPTSIKVSDGTKQYTISINSEGRIDW